mmetsp:Transcript_2283/g.3243  ORF Transcript_2283/g.3243 Transcript_2283/m.3243 type:complete len:286 (+) Transcript_2283:29-886(+)
MQKFLISFFIIFRALIRPSNAAQKISLEIGTKKPNPTLDNFNRHLFKLNGGSKPKPHLPSPHTNSENFPVQISLALAETGLQVGLLSLLVAGLDFASDYLIEKYSTDKSDSLKILFRLVFWFSIVFGSGFTSVLPGNYSTKLQAINIDDPLQKNWYENLRKPFWNPPAIVFPLMWIPLKILQAFSLTLLGKSVNQSNNYVPLLLYLVHKSLGDTWNKVWFGRKQMKTGAAVIVLFWISLVASLFFFMEEEWRSFLLLLPTLPWVTVATTLCLRIWRLNYSNAVPK